MVEAVCGKCGRALVQDPPLYCTYCGSMLVELHLSEDVKVRRRK